MLLRSLSHFVVLANEGDLTRAAKACKVRRSSISASVRELEAYLEAPLVDEQSGLLRLTTHGEKALTWAQKILGDYESMCGELAGMGHETREADPPRKTKCARR